MKLLHVTIQFQYAEDVQRILVDHGVERLVRYPMMKGRDRDGFHEGSQVWPGNVSVIQAQVEDDALEAVCEDLRAFRDEKEAHEHLEALVLPVERRL